MCRLTAEVRWFWLGSVPPDFRRWFTETDPFWCCAPVIERRVDEYLQDKNQTTLGIKRRGDTVEIKGLIAKPNKTLSFALCQSQLELWGKWSSECLDLSGVSLIALQKERSSRRFKTHNGEMVEVVIRNERITSGCNFEMTILTGSHGSRWWTLGFEAFGELNGIENLLVATIIAVAQRNPPDLPRGLPDSYPSWLAQRDF